MIGNMEFKIIDLKNKPLIRIFEEWNNVIINHYEKLPEVHPLNLTENTITGYLIAACGRLNHVAIQEYRTKQKIDGKIHKAFGDLFLFIDRENIFFVEAKLANFPELTSPRLFFILKERFNQVHKQIKQYQEARTMKYDNEKYMYLIYLVPAILPNKTRDEKELIEQWNTKIKEIKLRYYPEGSFIVSLRYHYSQIEFKADRGIDTGYPGVIILGGFI